MDGDRKYRQHGYQDSDRQSNGFRAERPKPNGPKLPLDVTGPKLPRLVQTVAAARCFNCAVMLPHDISFDSPCPKCGADLHCCKQCVHFDSSTRFQCLKSVPVRIASKDRANDCALFTSRVTVARDASAGSNGGFSGQRPVPANGSLPAAPRNASDARTAFDNLFKK